MHDISKGDYEFALDCKHYVEAIEKRVQKRLDKVQAEHDLGYEDCSNKIKKVEHELAILHALKAPHAETVSIYLEEQRCQQTDEDLREQWLRDNPDADLCHD